MTGIDPISLAIIKTLGGIVFKTVWEDGVKVAGRVGEGSVDATKRLIFHASQRYVQNYNKRHGILKVLGMREPVKLESVYADVKFLDHSDIRQFESVESLEAAYREAKQRSFQFQNSGKHDGLKVANEKQYLMVLGGPGAGKSTFLRRIGLGALRSKQGKFQHACVPVFIELKGFTTNDIDIQQVIAGEFEICGFPSPEESTQKLLEQGKLLILLDGLDEVPTNLMNAVICQIQNFVDRYDKNRFIASCRVAAYRHNFRRFTDVAMADFDDDQVSTFITNWFGQDINTARECWQKLNSREYHAAKELTQTPLLLTLVCLLYQHSRKFPTNRATLYERALRVLLEEWAAEKGIPHEDLYKGLDTKRKEMMLSEIAYQAFQEDRLFLPRREIANQIEHLLKELLPDEKVIDGAAILKSIEVQHGVLVARAEGIYSFSHLTIQEYLTAQYIDDHRQIEQLVKNHLTDQRWREVFLLVAGLLRGGADDLLLQMEQQAQTYLNRWTLQAFFLWAEEATANSDGNYKPAAKRATAILSVCTLDLARARTIGPARTLHFDRALGLVRTLDFDLTLDLDRALDLALDLALNLDLARNLARDRNLARKLERVKVFRSVDFTTLIAKLEGLIARMPNNQPVKVHREFVSQLLQTWYNAFNLNPEWVTLSGAEIKALENYFYACELMVRCKEAAVRVSPKIWEEIESRMVTVIAPQSPS